MEDLNTPKKLVEYFLEKRNIDINPSNMSRQIINIKRIMDKGFTLEIIKNAIDYYINVNPPINGIYSLKYIEKALENNPDQFKIKTYNKINFKVGDDNSTENNRRKFNNQSRFRKEYSFDMFKESRKDN